MTKIRVVGLISNNWLLMVGTAFLFSTTEVELRKLFKAWRKKTRNRYRKTRERARRERDTFLPKGKKYKPNPQKMRVV